MSTLSMNTYHFVVKEEWTDYNNHLNDAEYAKIFSLALEEWIVDIGLDAEAREKYAYSLYVLETHLCYLQEVLEGEKLTVRLQLLDSDEKRTHVIFLMENEKNELVATSEQMLMGMDMTIKRPAPFPKPVAAYIEQMAEEQKDLEAPKQAGSKIGIRRK